MKKTDDDKAMNQVQVLLQNTVLTWDQDEQEQEQERLIAEAEEEEEEGAAEDKELTAI